MEQDTNTINQIRNDNNASCVWDENTNTLLISGKTNIVNNISQGSTGAIVTNSSTLNLDNNSGSSQQYSPNSFQAIRGRITGNNLEHTHNYCVGLSGQYLITGKNNSVLPKTAILGVIGDNTTSADSAIMAYLDGDTGIVKAESAFNIGMKNSHMSSGFKYGLDLKIKEFGYASTRPFVEADIRFNNNVEIKTNNENTLSITGPNGQPAALNVDKLYVNEVLIKNNKVIEQSRKEELNNYLNQIEELKIKILALEDKLNNSENSNSSQVQVISRYFNNSDQHKPGIMYPTMVGACSFDNKQTLYDISDDIEYIVDKKMLKLENVSANTIIGKSNSSLKIGNESNPDLLKIDTNKISVNNAAFTLSTYMNEEDRNQKIPQPSEGMMIYVFGKGLEVFTEWGWKVINNNSTNIFTNNMNNNNNDGIL